MKPNRPKKGFFLHAVRIMLWVSVWALYPLSLAAQTQHEIRGVVRDGAGEPVIGAMVKIIGGSSGTVTDLKGEFSLAVPRDAEIEVTCMGYATQRIAVGAKDQIEVTMETSSSILDEIVVTGFGLAQRRGTLTGAVSVLGDADISRSVASTASGALVGKIPGINNRQSDGRPGSTTWLEIRNMGAPLFVIDGVQSSNEQFNNLDFNDIESVSVLKDATAAIYGLRAANGVIVINTKKGKLNTRNTVSLNYYYGWQNASEFPEPADAVTYLTNYIQSQTVLGMKYLYSREEYEKWVAGTEPGYQSFDWYRYIWGTTPQSYFNVNVTGGSDQISYYISAGQLSQDALMRDFGGFKRKNVQMNLSAQINKRLKVGMNMNGRIEARKNVAVPEDAYWIPRYSMYRNLPITRPYANDNPEYPQMTSASTITNYAVYQDDISGTHEDTWYVGQIQGTVEYDIIDGLKARALVGYSIGYRYMDKNLYTFDLYSYDEVTDSYSVSGTKGGLHERTMQHYEEYTNNIQLAYDKSFGDHNLSALVGFEAMKRPSPGIYLTSVPDANAIQQLNLETLTSLADWGENTEGRMGFLARFNYDYKDKYMVEILGRYDGSWKFAPGQRWGLFPAISAGWRVSHENFWKNAGISSIISGLKFRISYGILGDDAVGGYNAYDYLSGYQFYSGGSSIDGSYVIGMGSRGLPVETLSWIKARTFNVGLDVMFLNDRLVGQADYFERKRTGLPASRYDVLIPTEVGFSLPAENLNSDMHRGFDLSLVWTDKIDRFRYSVGTNLTYSRHYNWEQYKPRYSNSWDEYRNSSTHRYSYLNWGYEAIGQFQTWEEIASYQVIIDGNGNKTLRPGDIIYKDQNNDGVINSMDLRPIGYREGVTPIFNYGINLSAGWRGFDLAVDFTGASGFSYYQQWESREPFHGDGNNSQYYMSNTWRLSDIWDANSELIPGKYPMLLLGNTSHSNYWNSNFWKHNVRYIKLRNLEFGYTLPEALTKRVSITYVRVYLAGTNLLTFSNLTETDPEQTLDSGLGQPTTRVISLGINLKF